MASAKRTIDHDEIRRWVEEKGGCPSHVKGTGSGDDPGILRIDFPGFSGQDSLESISWDEFFEYFEENKLALLYREEDRFNKLVRRSGKDEREHANRGASAGEETGARAAQGGGDGGALVADLMSPDPVLCTPGTTCFDAAILMRDNDCGALPVVESLDNPIPVGVVTDRDLVVRGLAARMNPDDTLIVDVMTAEPFTISEDASVDEAMDLMEEKKIRRLIVVDEYGRCCGMLAQADLARAAPEAAGDVIESISEPGEEQRPTL